jgi:uncharacterized membrane protein YgcG
MITCKTCEPLLLHHLYGLLDDVESAALVQHLGDCPACQAALEKARQQQKVLAAAAKTEFPNVNFKPVEQSITRAVPRPAPLPQRTIRWQRWAVAATILLLVGGAGWTGLTWYSYSRAADNARVALAKAQKERNELERQYLAESQTNQAEITKIQQELALLETQYRNELSRVQREFDTQPVQFTVTHPKTLQAGGANQITIDAKRKAVPGQDFKMVALLVDEKNKAELARLALRDGPNDFVLPVDLPLKPGAQLSLRVKVAEGGKDEKTVIDETLPLVTSLYVTHLTTDRPMYRPGEMVYLRSLTLERAGMKPVDQDFDLHFRLMRAMGGQEQEVQVIDPATNQVAQMVGSSKLVDNSGAVLKGPDGNPLRGIGAGSFLLPAELPGGEYTLIVSESQDRFPAERRKLLVNRYQAPRLYKDVDFTRKSYGPGDIVTASCKVSPVEGGRVLSNLPVTAMATVDGVACEILTKGALKTDDLGQCSVQFRLPAKIERGEGVLSVTFTDNANVETTVEPIPIVVNKLIVEFFPEGGELVAGAVNRVYFQARTPLLKPAELRGQIIDKDGKSVVAIKTFSDDKEVGVNQGMGRFEFTPQAGQRYQLKIESPENIEGQFLLPPVQSTGVVMRSADMTIDLQNVGKARKLLVGAYCRGQLMEHQSLKLDAGGRQSVTLKPAADVTGVFRVTVFEVDDTDRVSLKPIAERLVYRRSTDRLNLQLFTDKKAYTPGDRVTLSLTATDQHNKPAPAIVLMSVVDKSVLKLRNDRTARALPSHFLLTSEVRGPDDLEYADVLLREDLPQAEVALDLLLGTQGWRRFVEQQLPREQARVMAAVKEDLERLRGSNGQASVAEKVKDSSAAKKANALVVRHDKLAQDLQTKAWVHAKKWETVREEQVRLTADINTKWKAARAAEVNSAKFQSVLRWYYKYHPTAIYVLVLLALLGLLLFFVRLGEVRAKVYLRYRRMCVIGAMTVAIGIVVATGLIRLANDENLPAFTGEQWAAALTYGAGDALGADWGDGGGDGPQIVERATARGKKDSLPAQRDLPQPIVQYHFDPAAKLQPILPEPPPPRAVEGANFLAKAKKGAKGLRNVPPGNDPATVKKADDLGMAKLREEMRTPLDFDVAQNKQVWGKLAKPSEADEKVADAPRATGAFGAKGGGGGKGGGFGGAGGGFGGGGFAADHVTLGRLIVERNSVPFPLRQYAHVHPTNVDNMRRDFAETVYWHPALVLPGDKPLDVSFDLSDAVTQFEVKVWGHTLDGRLGALTKDIASRLPFSLDAKLPIEISNTDKITIPVAVANDTEKNRHVMLKVEADSLRLGEDSVAYASGSLLPVDANSRVRKLVQFQPSITQGEAKLRLLGLCEPFGADSIERSFKIVPEGFPVTGKQSGMLEGVETHTVRLPAKRDQWVPGTLKLQAQVFPSTLADLQKGLEALLREPGGCFEQTSSSNYPNIMILDYLKESNQVNPAIEKRALVLLGNGYGKLIAFECIDPKTAAKKQGYEWFGQTAPPHEALTAYGLVQFLDMAKYQKVDQAMLERTKNYLLGQRNGKGGFRRNQRAVDSFGRAPEHITDAYIVWALSEAEVKEDISLELNAVVAKANETEDPYLLALAGLSLLKRGQADTALPLLKKLAAKQKEDGSLVAKETSITHSGGVQLAVETTSLAVLAWSRANRPADFTEPVRKGADWIGKQRGAFGGYGSTQSTILALKALIAYTRDNKKTATAGELRLYVNGRAEPVAVKAFPAGTQETLVVELADDKLLEPGENKVRVEITGGNIFPHTLSWSYMALTPANKDACPVRLTTKMANTKAKEGQALTVTATLENTSGKEQGMAVAIIGLPGGCSLPVDLQELRNLVKAGKIDAFEVKGRELVLYWRGLAKDARHEVNVNVICQVPGQYRGPASRAYLYYNADERWWVEPLGVEIK